MRRFAARVIGMRALGMIGLRGIRSQGGPQGFVSRGERERVRRPGHLKGVAEALGLLCRAVGRHTRAREET